MYAVNVSPLNVFLILNTNIKILSLNINVFDIQERGTRQCSLNLNLVWFLSSELSPSEKLLI